MQALGDGLVANDRGSEGGTIHLGETAGAFRVKALGFGTGPL